METGTLKELNVRVGDVVKWGGSEHVVLRVEALPKGSIYEGQIEANLSDFGTGVFMDEQFTIISRANPTPFGGLSDEKKGALLLARYEGKVIECYRGSFGWYITGSSHKFSNSLAYRVKPETIVKTVALCYRHDTGTVKNKIGTIQLVNGVPDPASIKMDVVK